MKRFKGLLITPYFADTGSNSDTALEFTKTQIIIPKELKDLRFQDSDLKHGAHYQLILHDNIDRTLRYEVRLNKGQTIRLVVNKWNEWKLKWVHGMYRIQKEPLAFVAIIISAISLLTSILRLFKK